MANIQVRRDKDGKLVSFSIRVFRGRDKDGKQLKPWTETFDVEPTWTEKSARKKAEARAAVFEMECRSGLTSDTRLRFDEFTNYVLGLKEERGLIKHSTLVRYRELATRIFPEIGHIKIRDLRVDHLNSLYSKLGQTGEKYTVDKAKAKIDLARVLPQQCKSHASISRDAGLAASTVAAAVRGECVSRDTAEKVAGALGMKIDRAFFVVTESKSLCKDDY